MRLPQADPSLAAALDGVACDPARHTTFLDVEPNTGGLGLGPGGRGSGRGRGRGRGRVSGFLALDSQELVGRACDDGDALPVSA